MRQILLVLFSTFISLQSHAGPKPDPATMRVLSDAVIVGTLNAVQSKYGLGCEKLDSAKLVRWMCLNGEVCGFEVSVLCKGGDQLASVRFAGIDNGFETHVTQSTIDRRSGIR
ncbi:MAG: hypothetical protein IT289_07105 [Oligoflexia bacterium]|nr:hypothetical protein [Oligoflexia bacterium]